MKRAPATSSDHKSDRPFKKRHDRPFNITMGSSSNNDKKEPLLGSKTKGAVYLRDQSKEKQQFGNFTYGNYHGYYTYVIS